MHTPTTPRALPWLTALALLVAPSVALAQAKKRYEQMEYGPFLTATLEIPGVAKINKGVAIHLGGDSEAAICFDIDLCRYGAGWTEGFLNLRGTPYDGAHGPAPAVQGKVQWKTTGGPGWAKPGTTDLKDPRKEPYGPLPREWARFLGMYVHGDKVLPRYKVGDCEILELPSFAMTDGRPVFTRTINASASTQPLTHVILDMPGNGQKQLGGPQLLGFGGATVSVVGLVNAPEGATLEVDGTRVLLKLPALKTPAKFRVNITTATAEDFTNGKLATLAGKTTDNLDLTPFTKGGPPRWKADVTTKGTLGKEPGAYVADTLTVPEDNPYKSWMRFGGLDFFADGNAAISTWSGDVWIVSGIDDKLEKLTWKRFATGLFQPLGLKVVDGKVYTLGREGIMRLHDLNGDGEADYYELFNGDVHTTPGFHEFAFDLQTDPEGNFYFAKGGPVRGGGSGFEYIAEHSGCIMKVSKDGSKMEVVATGFRAPNGMCIGPRGEITSGDNEGTWMPMCRINYWTKPGGFGGCVDTAHRDPKPEWYDDPICWLPKSVDNSNGGQAWVTDDRWGPLKGELLHTSYGTSSLYHVLRDPGERVQGGVIKIPVNFLSGICRPRFNPVDGQLYVVGLRGWQTNAARDACFQRVRYTGKPLNSVAKMALVKGGIELTFTDALDAKVAGDAKFYAAKEWNYLWRVDYGSRDYSAADPDFDKKVREYNALRAAKAPGEKVAELYKSFKEGRDTVKITGATVSPDGKTVRLDIPELKKVMQMELKMKVKAADGTPLDLTIWNTINAVPTK
jgi:hypothetical protein